MNQFRDHRADQPIELISIYPIQKDRIETNSETVDPDRHPDRPTVSVHIQVSPAEDRHERGHHDDEVKKPIWKIGGFEIGRNFFRIGVEESGERLHGKQVDEHDEEECQ